MNFFHLPVWPEASRMRSRKCLRPVGLFLGKNDLVSSKLEGFLRHLPTSETNIVFPSSYDLPPAQNALSRSILPASGHDGSFAQFVRRCSLIMLAVILTLTMQAPLLHAKSKTYAKRGMWIGAASGVVVGGTIFAVMTARDKCSSDSDFQICGNAQGVTLMTIGGAVLGGLVGMGVGTIIGSSIKRQEEVVLAPIISVQEDRAIAGLAFSKRF